MSEEVTCPLSAAMSAIKEELAKDLADAVLRTNENSQEVSVAARTLELE